MLRGRPAKNLEIVPRGTIVGPTRPHSRPANFAAPRLGISESGVRKRVKREQLDATNEEGRVYVYLDSAVTEADTVPDIVPDKEIERLEDHIASLERQLEESNVRDRENRRIIIALTSRIPELEASQEPRESPTPSPEASEGTTPQPERVASEEPAQCRPWWRRMFGG